MKYTGSILTRWRCKVVHLDNLSERIQRCYSYCFDIVVKNMKKRTDPES